MNHRSERTYANNALRANQLDQLIIDAALGIALAVGLEVTQITNVALVIFGSTMGLVVGVDYAFVSPNTSLYRSVV